MTRNTANTSGQPSIETLMVRFLAKGSDIVESGEFEPHEATAGFRVDPRAAWIDATSNITAVPMPIPGDWAALVNQSSAAYAVPMAAGNFPQRVRDLQPLIAQFNPTELRQTATQIAPQPAGLRNWISKHAASEPVLAAGLSRLLGDFETAESLLPAEADNERAALLWQRGEWHEALSQWVKLPDSPAVLFNCGMALLFLGNFEEAAVTLSEAIEVIPETSGWNSLAKLYRALAEIHA